jgi:hypothetical protein
VKDGEAKRVSGHGSPAQPASELAGVRIDPNDFASPGGQGNAQQRAARLIDAEIRQGDHCPAIATPSKSEHPPARRDGSPKATELRAGRNDKPGTRRRRRIGCGPT